MLDSVELSGCIGIPDGDMNTGWVLDNDGKWYYLGENGAMMTNGVTPDGYRVDADGKWIR